jgi:uncharacterized protein VirK/YbjX
MQHFRETSSDFTTQKLSQFWAQLLTLSKPIALVRVDTLKVIIDEMAGEEKLRLLEQSQEILARRSFFTSNLNKRN